MSSNFPIHHGVKIAQGGYIVNAVVESLAADPNPVGDIGRIWFNSTENVYKQAVDNGSGGVAVKVYATVDQINALQSELNDTQVGAGLDTDGTYIQNGSANYIATSTSLADADNDLDAAIKVVADDLAQEVIDRGAADDALDGRLDTVEGSYINKDGSVAFTGNVDMGTNKVTNLGAPVNGSDAATKTYVDDEIATIQSSVEALGSAFNYVQAVTGGANSGAAFDLNTLTEKDAGDYYKVGGTGLQYFKVGAAGTPFTANPGDGLVFNTTGGVDKIDNTDSTVAGTTDFITVTGSADTGFVVDVATTFKDRMTTAEGDISTVESSVGLGGDGSFTLPTGHNYLTGDVTVKDTIASLDSALKVVDDALAQEVIDREAGDDDIIAGAGLQSDGSYAANVTANYIASSTSLKDADDDLDAALKVEEDARIQGDSDLQAELDATQFALGINTDGTFSAFSGSSYLDATSTIKGALTALDVELAALADLVGGDTDLIQAELDEVEASVGLASDGTYVLPVGHNYLTGDVTIKDNIASLDSELKSTNDALAQEVTDREDADDAIIAGAGLASGGSYSAPAGNNYLSTAVSLNDADSKLDAKIKAMFDAINNANFYQEYSTAATTHTVEHNLNSAAITFTVMVDRDGNGDWRNDVVSVKHTDNNTLTVYLSVAKKVRVAVQKVADITI